MKAMVRAMGLLAAGVVFSAGLVLAEGVQGMDPIEKRKEIVDAVDWKAVEKVTVELKEHNYTPDKLVFKAGQPYQLIMRNVGEKKHYFTAPEFFKAISARKVQSDKDGEIKAPYFLAIEMMPKGGQLDLYFVPVTKGSYPLYCTESDHRQQGMEGSVVIE
ncbi:MAG: cupredoxin domain-containing protein [Magnetococcales bacterium]|nr:cupredoxin domain-containing protein [Magnetococcales bacterium]